MAAFFRLSYAKFFSLYGIIFLLILIIPNFMFAKNPPKDRPEKVPAFGAGICMLEILSQWIFYISMVFIRFPHREYGYLISAGVFLLFYCLLWARYFKRGCHYPDIYTYKILGINIPIFLPKDVSQILIALWLGNNIALVSAIVYAVCNTMNTIKAVAFFEQNK